jgi:hypothetical protein
VRRGPDRPLRLLACVADLGALALLVVGLLKTVVFERTPGQVADEGTGLLVVLVGCLLLLGLALVTWHVAGTWAAAAVAAPAVVCGGLTVVAGGTLLPQLLALPACAVALAGLGALLAGRGRQRE